MKNFNLIKIKGNGFRDAQFLHKFVSVKKRVHCKEQAFRTFNPEKAKNYDDIHEMISDYNKLIKMGETPKLINVQHHYDEKPILIKEEKQ